MIYGIIAITVVISIWAFNSREIFNRLNFNPYSIKNSKEGWRFFSYGLIHANWAHLFINMFVLYSFGRLVENAFIYLEDTKGIFYFLLLYVGGIIFSVLFDYKKHLGDIYYSAVGASGAVSAVVFSGILMNPTGSVYLFFIPIPIPAAIFGVLYLVYSAYMSKRGGDNIGHSAHFWGAVFGVVFTIIVEPRIATIFWQQIFG